ncbi:MAG: hypothetical protein MK078_17280 [Crocinitomicaceae bacterium]|nr:hypothetical protein [Crocinitomicaceae bacterium]
MTGKYIMLVLFIVIFALPYCLYVFNKRISPKQALWLFFFVILVPAMAALIQKLIPDIAYVADHLSFRFSITLLNFPVLTFILFYLNSKNPDMTRKWD